MKTINVIGRRMEIYTAWNCGKLSQYQKGTILITSDDKANLAPKRADYRKYKRLFRGYM